MKPHRSRSHQNRAVTPVKETAIVFQPLVFALGGCVRDGVVKLTGAHLGTLKESGKESVKRQGHCNQITGNE